jgi:hypothetical protein
MGYILTIHAMRGLQRDVVYLGWPIAPSYMSPNAGGGRELRGFSQWVHLFTRSRNRLWRSNTILNLYMPYKKKCLFELFYVYFLKTNDKNIFSSAVRASYCTRIYLDFPCSISLLGIHLLIYIIKIFFNKRWFFNVSLKKNLRKGSQIIQN